MNAQHFQTAADVLDREAKRFQQLAESATALRALGELASVSDALEARAAKAREDLAAIELEYEASSKALKQSQMDAAKVFADAQELAAEAERKADEKAAQIIAEAENKANGIVNAAQTQANDMRARAGQYIEDVTVKVNALNDELNALALQKKDAEQSLAGVNSALEDARAKVRALVAA